MVEPRSIVREILEYIGIKGIVAGGALRDIVLDRQPKDYDVFLFKKMWLDEITSKHGIFDTIPKRVEYPKHYGSFEIWNTTLHGEVVQIIWSPAFEPVRKIENFLQEADHLTGQEIVDRFPFTVNMIYADHRRKIYIQPRAREALRGRKLIYNVGCVPPHPRGELIVKTMLKRAFYLAAKLNWTLPMSTIDTICAKHYYVDELSNREWTKEEGILDATFPMF